MQHKGERAIERQGTHIRYNHMDASIMEMHDSTLTIAYPKTDALKPSPSSMSVTQLGLEGGHTSLLPLHRMQPSY